MLIRYTSLVLLGVGIFATLAGSAAAQDFFPATTRHYKFLPQSSVLNQHGGFAGLDIDYNVVGTYDFITTPSPLAVYPPIIIGDFDKVSAAGVRGFQDYAIKLDDAFNLSGLTGSTQLGGPTTVFRFTGETHDGSSVELWAATRGPWMYLRGETTPPPGSADFFEYDIKALAHERPFADFNDDAAVDGQDLTRWMAPSGFVGGDFLSWQRQLGDTPPSDAEFEAAIASASHGAAAAAPEPGGLLLAIAGATFFVTRRRRLCGI